MNQFFSQRRKRHQPKRAHPNRGLQVARPPPLERWRFPTLPREFQISLRSTYTDQRTGGQTTQAAKIQPLFEFNGTFPAMSPELFQIYRLARIKAISISMEIINTSTTPLTATLCCLPLTIAQGVTDPRNISSIPGSITKQVGIATGMSRSRIVKTFVGEKELGQSALSGKEYSQSFSEALLPAVESDFPAIYSGVISTVTSASWTGVVNYVYTWHVEFTEYTTGLTGSIDPRKQEKVMAKDSFDQDDVDSDHEESRKGRNKACKDKRQFR